MSIRWDIIKPLLTAVIGDISGADKNVRWMDESKFSTWGDQTQQSKPMVFLQVSSVERQGIEEEYYGEIDNADLTIQRSVVVAGQRRFMLTVRVESFEQDRASENHAGNVADAIAIRLMRRTTLQRIAGICAIENRLPTQWFDYKDGGRQVSCYVMEIQMRTVDNDIDTSLSSGSWINEAKIQSNTINGPDGLPLPAQIDLDVKGAE